MAQPLAVDKEAVRVLVVAVGVREAARRMKLPEGTVAAWSARGKWLEHQTKLASAISGASSPAKDAISESLPASMRPSVPRGHASGAINAADALQAALADDSQACRVAALKFGRKTLEFAAEVSSEAPGTALAMAGDVASITKSVALAGSWAVTQGAQAPTITLNVGFLLDCQAPGEPAGEIRDVSAEVTCEGQDGQL